MNLLKPTQTFRNSKSGLCNKGKDCFPDGNYWVVLYRLSNFFLVLRSESGLQKYISFLEQIRCKTETNCLLTKSFNFGTKSRISSTLSKTPFILNFPLQCSAQRVGFFNIGSGRVGYWTKYRVAGRVRVG